MNLQEQLIERLIGVSNSLDWLLLAWMEHAIGCILVENYDFEWIFYDFIGYMKLTRIQKCTRNKFQ